MTFEKITHKTNIFRNFKCEFCSNKIRTDDIGLTGSPNPGLFMFRTEVLCPVCNKSNFLPYYQASDDRIEGEEYVNYDDYMAKVNEVKGG